VAALSPPTLTPSRPSPHPHHHRRRSRPRPRPIPRHHKHLHRRPRRQILQRALQVRRISHTARLIVQPQAFQEYPMLIRPHRIGPPGTPPHPSTHHTHLNHKAPLDSTPPTCSKLVPFTPNQRAESPPAHLRFLRSVFAAYHSRLGGMFDWMQLFRPQRIHCINKKPVSIPLLRINKWERLRTDLETVRVSTFNLQLFNFVSRCRRFEPHIFPKPTNVSLEKVKLILVYSKAWFKNENCPRTRICDSHVNDEPFVEVHHARWDIPLHANHHSTAPEYPRTKRFYRPKPRANHTQIEGHKLQP
jgi:hypothetical protein